MSTLQATGATASHPFTCNTCQVAYRNAELQKSHMKSDWHRYNLKRRVASLPPISAEAFTEKVLQARAQTTAEADKAFFEKTCQVCEKTYYSENSFQNHLSSQKHRAREARGIRPSAAIPDETSSVMSSTFSLGEPVKGHHDDDDDDDEDEDDLESASAEAEFNKVVEGLQKTTVSDTRPSPVKRPSNPQATTARKDSESRESNERDSGSATPTPSQPDPSTLLQQCLFCRYMSPTVNLNAHHMERFHGMVIPEKEYLVDLDGLIKYLASKIYEDFECLTCGKAKSNAFAVQTHMRDVGHCTIPYTTEEEQLEIGDFYDFRSTYSDEEEEAEEEESGPEPLKINGSKLGAKRSESVTDENGEKISVEEDGWETDSSASSIDSEELTAVPADDRQNQCERLNKSHHHSHEDPRQHHLVDGWHSHAHKHNARSVFHDDYELHLPSGKSVGHRSLNRYYRQNLHNYPTAEERAERERLAIENGDANGDSDAQSGGEDGTAENPNRAVIPRTQQGIMGVTDQAKGQLARDIHQSRKMEQVQGAKRDMAYSTKLNKQKNYYYRYERGG